MERTRLHKLEDILVISTCALLCGAESFEDMEVLGGEIVAIDGKALRRAVSEGGSPKVIVRAWATGSEEEPAKPSPRKRKKAAAEPAPKLFRVTPGAWPHFAKPPRRAA